MMVLTKREKLGGLGSSCDLDPLYAVASILR
jgi:hypothetical protein